MSVDYADVNVSCNETYDNNGMVLDNGTVVGVNESDSFIILKTTDKVHTHNVTNEDVPTITITARPSVRSNYAYKWYTTVWVDYCPHCHRYHALYNAHKWQARYEQELTCKFCGADYCGVVGKEKYSWSYYYLTRA